MQISAPMDNSKSRIIIAIAINLVMFAFAFYEAINMFGASKLRFGMLAFSSAVFLTFLIILVKRFIRFGYHKSTGNS